MSRSSAKRRGFTLVEMLVVISIIGILMSLLVPAAMSAREKGRVVQCGNNVRQLGLALISYESTFRIYPLNWGWTTDRGDASSRGQSWISLILPQLDSMPMYQRIKMGAPLNFRTVDSSNRPIFDNSLVARTAMPILKCPTDITDGTALTSSSDQVFGQLLQPLGEDNSGTSPTVAVTNYKACCGSMYPQTQTATIRRGRNYNYTAAQTGMDRRDYCGGIMCRGYNPTVNDSNKTKEVLFPTSSADIFDGAGMTIAIGEALPSICPWSAWFWWNGSTAAAGFTGSAGTAYSSPINYSLNRTRVDANFLPSNSSYAPYFYGFNSRHAGSAQFVMCDGAVHSISESIDRTVFYKLGTMDDREVIDSAALGW